MAYFRAVPNIGSGGGTPTVVYSTISGSTKSSHTITGMSGKKLIILTYMYSSSSNIGYTAKDISTISGGTATVLARLTSSSQRAAGTISLVNVTSNTLTIKVSSGNAYCIAISL